MVDHARKTGAALEAHFQLLLWLVPTVEKFPKSQRMLLSDRIQKVALDIQDSLIEATYSRDRRGHLIRANLGLEKLRFLFRLAVEMHYLDKRRYEHACRAVDEVGRLVGGWLKADQSRSTSEPQHAQAPS